MINKSKKILKDLINSISPSGYEGPAAKIWKKEANLFSDKVWTDTHGSSHAIVNKSKKITVMLAGHCDEIGFQVSYVDENGFIWIQPIGGWDAQIAQGQRVQILTKKGIVKGVIGKLAIHLQTPEQRKKVSEIKDLWIDIGSKDKKQTESLVEIGDPLVIDYGFDDLNNDGVVDTNDNVLSVSLYSLNYTVKTNRVTKNDISKWIDKKRRRNKKINNLSKFKNKTK